MTPRPERRDPATATALLALAWVLATGAGCEAEPRVAEARRTDAPELEVPLLSGADFVLSEQRGRTVILDFWATWCAPCEVQMPVLDALWSQRAEDGLVVVGVSVDTDPAERVEGWVRARGLDYPIGLGSQELAQRFGVLGYPTLFVIDPNGGIHTQHVGVLSRPELEEILDEIAEQAGPDA